MLNHALGLDVDRLARLGAIVHDARDAAQLGESIIAEFPRSRMSHEVRAMIEMIRGRASSAAVVSEPPT